MCKFILYMFLISTNSLIEQITTTERRIIYPQRESSSEESSDELIRNDFSDQFYRKTVPKTQTNSAMTYRESEQNNSIDRRESERVAHDSHGHKYFDKSTKNRESSEDEVNHSQRDWVSSSDAIVYPSANDRVQNRDRETTEKTYRYQDNRKTQDEDNRYFSEDISSNSISNNDQISRVTSAHSTTPETSSDRNGNSGLLSGSSTSRGRTKTETRKTQRLCEQKYMEYMTRIFRDDDTVADGNDSDFDGRVLVEPGEYPHMTALGFGAPNQPLDYKCGGSLISETFVLTAAHCANLTGLEPKKVRIGDLNLMVEEHYLEPQIRNISRIFVHPEYRSHLDYNDIALLELEEPVEFTEFVRPIKLWIDMELPANITAHAMGYGATGFGKARTNRLTDMNLTVVPNDVCKRDMPEMSGAPLGIISSQICARDYLMNRDTCQGDSGGPLQLNLRGRRRQNRKHYHLIGITSYGLFCRSNYPSVYTRVAAFLDWIEQIVWLAQL